MYIDSHCHIQTMEHPELIIDAMGENLMIVNGTDLVSNQQAIALAEQYKNVYAAVGCLPESKCDCDVDDLSFRALLENSNVVAIGEIGLDYYWDTTYNEEQRQVLEQMLNYAEEYHKPVILHQRNSFEDIISALDRHPNVTGILHSFCGTLAEAQAFIDRGMLLGINGMVTFRKNDGLRAVVKEIPLEYIVLETDSPYLAPEPVRGKINTPLNIQYIAEKIGNIKNISYEEVMEHTLGNIISRFDISKNL